MAEILIHDGNFHRHLSSPQGHARGLVPRDKRLYPRSMFSAVQAFTLPLIPRDQWPARLDQQKQTHSQLSDIRNRGMGGSPIPSRDQNGVGYCWCHSGTSAHLIARAIANEPYLDLSAFSVGCMIKNFRDEGGNGIEGVQFQASKGIATADKWPQRSMDRKNDNPETWANAARHKYVQYMELDSSHMEDQFITCLLLGIPVVADYNWWSHSVMGMDVVEIGKTGRIWNSWGDSWSENGTGLLAWNKFIPDDAVACIVTSPST